MCHFVARQKFGSLLKILICALSSGSFDELIVLGFIFSRMIGDGNFCRCCSNFIFRFYKILVVFLLFVLISIMCSAELLLMVLFKLAGAVLCRLFPLFIGSGDFEILISFEILLFLKYSFISL